MRDKKITNPNMQRFGKSNGLFKGGTSRDFSRRVAGAKPNSGDMVHHKNGNPTDNSKANLQKMKMTGGKKSKTSKLHEYLTKRAKKS